MLRDQPLPEICPRCAPRPRAAATAGPIAAVLLGLLVSSSVARTEEPEDARSPVRGAVAAHLTPNVTHGPMAGEVTPTSAVVWARGDGGERMEVRVRQAGAESGSPERVLTSPVRPGGDFTGKVRITGLRPATEYRYRVRFTHDLGGETLAGREAEGTFRSAPAPGSRDSIRLAWGGDVAGQNVCRDAAEGFPIFRTIVRHDPDLFLALGDMIYADDLCEEVGLYGNAQVPGGFVEGVDLPNYWAHWKYNREDPGFRALVSSRAYFGLWDDHEVVNDFGPLGDTRASSPWTAGVPLLPIGLRAFLDYSPITIDPSTPLRLYRRVRWGAHLELFVLDNRQYRDSNRAPDLAATPKTMLGREQVAWLRESVVASDATWKVIVSSVPLAIPTGSVSARDGFADHGGRTGFERELLDLLAFFRDRGVHDQLWITTDVHFAQVMRHTPFDDAPDFRVHEIATGPLNAGIFPNRTLDDTLGSESLFFFGPESSGAVTDWEEAKSWFNFGALEIAADGELSASVIGMDGEPLYTLSLTPRETPAVKPGPIVIAHRGASGYLPEHTLAAYELAIRQGADFIEPDLVATKDGHLIARHDNVLGLTTDVASRPEFRDRRATKTIDGVEIPDSYFSEDFTLAEIKTLRAIERVPDTRPSNKEHDGKFEVPTLQEIIALARRMESETGRPIGIYPETKHPSYFAARGISTGRELVEILHASGYTGRDAPVFIQSFEVENLRELDEITELRLVQLLWLAGKPYDVELAGGSLTYDEMATPAGLAEIAKYADGVGPEKYHFIIPRTDEGLLDFDAETTFVRDAHAAGLVVHPYTFRAENVFLPRQFRVDTTEAPEPATIGNAVAEMHAFLRAGIDGFFTDQPDVGVRARDSFVR